MECHWAGTVKTALKSNAGTGSSGQITSLWLRMEKGAAGCREPAGVTVGTVLMSKLGLLAQSVHFLLLLSSTHLHLGGL